jgi:hypothetical protein
MQLFYLHAGLPVGLTVHHGGNCSQMVIHIGISMHQTFLMQKEMFQQLQF